MKNTGALLGIVLLALGGCSTVPVTGRHALILVPESQISASSLQAYNDLLKKSKMSTDAKAVAMVKRVGERIAKVSDAPDFQWEYNLIDDAKTVNAFCMPGGKTAVYTGILPMTQTEVGLAVVMGHEIAHAVAKHGAERMSQGLITAFGATALSEAMKTKPAETQKIALAAFGVGAQFGVLLPFSRSHESEADHIGLIYMAKAGYDPREAVLFWERMEKMSSGKQPPEFMSTHPSHGTRVDNLKKWMPEALQYYEESPIRPQ